MGGKGGGSRVDGGGGGEGAGGEGGGGEGGGDGSGGDEGKGGEGGGARVAVAMRAAAEMATAATGDAEQEEVLGEGRLPHSHNERITHTHNDVQTYRRTHKQTDRPARSRGYSRRSCRCSLRSHHLLASLALPAPLRSHCLLASLPLPPALLASLAPRAGHDRRSGAEREDCISVLRAADRRHELVAAQHASNGFEPSKVSGRRRCFAAL